MIDLLKSRLLKDERIVEALKFFDKSSGEYLLYGLSGESKALIIAIGTAARRMTLIISHDDDEQRFLCKELRKLLPEKKVLALPVDEGEWLTSRAHSRDSGSARIAALGALLGDNSAIVVATIQSVTQKLPPARMQKLAKIKLKVGLEYEFGELQKKLIESGYERCDEIEGHGQFALRGGIIDIFPTNSDNPVRIEFYGDEIDGMREFDLRDQRSIEKLETLEILPFRLSGKAANISEYLPDDVLVVFDESARARDNLKKVFAESSDRRREFLTFDELRGVLNAKAVIQISSLVNQVEGIASNHIVGVQARQIPPYRRRFDMFINDAKEFIARDYAVLVTVTEKCRSVEIAQYAENNGIKAAQFFNVRPQPEQLGKPRLYVIRGELAAGIEFVGCKTIVVSESDLFVSRKPVQYGKTDERKRGVFLGELKAGDYVVHGTHGIGRYVGVETLLVDDAHKDYFHIQYSGTDKLFVPVEQVQLLSRYVGGEDVAPKLSKLGHNDWEKKKTRAKKAVEDIAEELLALHAGREAATGIAFSPDNEWQQEFEAAFPYVETEDQLSAIVEIKADMESISPMERLLCGDVGFGKTEVAMRAAFKAVMSGYQVAVLAPTTVLALQHYNNFHMRCSGFGVKVGLNCRLVREETRRLTMNAAREGKLDILIGTHGLLRDDVSFKKIGLLIIDEEQRFGVKQKEFLKKWQGNADILSLSATPIPRTLHLALGGARNMSIIETPPPERLPVQTYVIEATDEIVRQAIRKELNRGGQVFFVYNRVQTMDKVFLKLRDIVPEANVVMAHGQMSEELMEQAITDFYEGKYNVLLATTIIENGVDMPNVNTIIVYDADRFGLSQLHQLRGRVGRSNRQAYAYFFYRENKVVNEVAERRLRAVQDFTELGVGFKIAMRDMEIRGAGDILGSQQHGHIMGVGFMLYAKMLEEAIRRLRGGKPVELPLEPRIDIKVDGYIPRGYVDDAMHKIEIYQKIAAARDEEGITDVLDELIDRFGEPPQEVMRLLMVARIKNTARTLGIAEVLMQNGQLTLNFSDKPNIDPEKIIKLKTNRRYIVNLKIKKPERISVEFRENQKDDVGAINTVLKILVD
ncbi:MAG: transcription-repair coupling factor [Negativicutes bacterium]